MKSFDYDQAHAWVDSQKNAFWDKWDIVVWNRNHNGATNKNGLFRNGVWGIANRFTLNEDGTWRIPDKYVR
jgi:hypothetical protein